MNGNKQFVHEAANLLRLRLLLQYSPPLWLWLCPISSFTLPDPLRQANIWYRAGNASCNITPVEWTDRRTEALIVLVSPKGGWINNVGECVNACVRVRVQRGDVLLIVCDKKTRYLSVPILRATHTEIHVHTNRHTQTHTHHTQHIHRNTWIQNDFQFKLGYCCVCCPWKMRCFATR